MAVAAAALCLGVLAGTAGAAKATSVKTTVKIYSGNSERFSGRVTTGKKKACMKARKVTLYVNTASAGQRAYGRYPGYEAVGTATTKANGTWLVRTLPGGRLPGLRRGEDGDQRRRNVPLPGRLGPRPQRLEAGASGSASR
jgi:hypothetical protein